MTAVNWGILSTAHINRLFVAGARQAEKEGKPVDGARGQIKEEGGD